MKKAKKETQLGMMLTETEALRWGKMDAEMRNDLQALRLENYEIETLNRNYVQQKQAHELMKKQLLDSVEARKRQYQELTKTLAEKYKVDPQKMAIDPDTGSIREVS